MGAMGITVGPVCRRDRRTPAVVLADPKFRHGGVAVVRAASCYGARLVCYRFVVIQNRHCTDLSVAVYPVVHDRRAKRVVAGLDEPHAALGRGFNEPDQMADAVGVR
jgi:hypothetical protein